MTAGDGTRMPHQIPAGSFAKRSSPRAARVRAAQFRTLATATRPGEKSGLAISVRVVLAGLAALAVIGTASSVGGVGAARRGPLAGSDAWLRTQHLLRDPAASLRRARAAWERGDRPRAEWLLEELAERHPIIADYADWMRVQLLAEQGRDAEAAELAQRALASYVDSPLRADLYRQLGNLYVRFDSDEAARAAWRGALDETRDPSLRAPLLEATAASEERSGEPQAAARTYALLWSLHPTSREAGAAEERLEALEKALEAPLRSAIDWRRRGDELFRKRHNEEALAAYERALELGLSASETRRALRQRARVLFRLRRYPEAAQAFSILPDVDDVALWHARSLARAGEVSRAIREFESLAQRARGELSIRSGFLAALLLQGQGHSERARRQLSKVARNRSTPGLANAALWRLAWGSYRDARYTEAISLLEQLMPRERDPIGRLRSRYWRARALGHATDAESAAEALREFAEIAREYPLSYYGWRARQRVPANQLEVRPGQPATIPEGMRDLSSEALVRPRILLAAGLVSEAIEEMQRVRRRARGLSDRLSLAQLFADAGDYRGAQRLVVDAYTEVLARGPVSSLEELWWHAWPAAYGDLVTAATSSPGSVDPALVLSIMREESGFQPQVVSPNGARGLLQIMASTGERLARSVGQEDFCAEDLFQPEVNIRLGSHYLEELTRQFEGRLSAAIASYNAGPERVSQWMSDGRELGEDDEWVESIPYDQTRAYVKRVLRSLQAYQLLY
jgi:soluble lytic murein transglycosylase